MNAAKGLRERKKATTRATIQEQALRLFLSKGYDATTVEEIAAAAGVSHMTFFRYFPTKEDVVLADEYDAQIAERLRSRRAGESPIECIRRALLQGLELMSAADREVVLARARLIIGTQQLRARLWEQQHATERLIADALATSWGSAGGEGELRARVIASACLAAVSTAVAVWAEGNGVRELADLIDQSLCVLASEVGAAHG